MRRRQQRTPWVPIIVGIVLVALLTAGGIVAFRLLRPVEVTEAPTGPATQASDAVAGYLHALADGDLEAALAYGQSEPTDRAFITQDVLDASRERAPITDIRVTEEDDPDAFEVTASYRLGDQPVEASFAVIHDGEQWLLLDTTASLSVADLRQKNLPININGVPVGNSNELTVLPGGYTFDTGLDRISYGDNTTLVSAPGSRQRAGDLSPTLTDTGSQDLIAAGQASLDDCLSSRELAPPGCPFAVKLPDGSTAEPGTVTWTLVGDPFAESQPSLEWTDHGAARLPAQVTVTFTATIRTGQSTGTVEQQVTNNSVLVADILAEPLQVSWQG